MKPLTIATAALLSLAAAGSAAAAQPLAQYSLNQGKVHFGVPTNWVAMMQKTSGDPQLYAFQVPNAKAPDTLTRVTVSTHQVGDMTAFAAFVKNAMAKAAQMDAYASEATPGGQSTALRFRAEEDGDKLRFREHFYYKSGLAVTLRCVSPAAIPAASSWHRAYVRACDALAAELAK
ncbi:MAG TPA: hypothetical protein VFG73_08570 [Rhodanobacteraceae bacterium]|nr:hypothetical protein [Rhodanobacteraceae bacterium]